ncbi:voltage-gated potassium channel [Aureococcus anophagefferens]|uniref:Voltage-gated potassium channel n=1 Tax=Aureococcus anophagefferens TaxID=44056 RepID=A0ABR1FPU7_AURAN
MEWFACTVFTAEIVARFAITNSARTLIRDPYMWFDILAVLPCWLIPTASLIPGGTALCGGLSHLKSLRMFRLLKLARKYEGSIVIVRAMKLSLPALTVAIFFLMISVTVFATFLFFTESLNREGAYRSIPHAMWFMMVTMTTVGYGDVSPLTDGGKVVTTMAMLFGVLFLAMPLAIVGNNFCLVWEDKERVVFVEKLKEQLLLRGRQPKDMRETFNMMDTDGSGSMSFREFRDAMRVLEINMSAERLAVLWRTLDADHSGEIDVSEFMELVYRDDPYVLSDAPGDGAAPGNGAPPDPAVVDAPDVSPRAPPRPGRSDEEAKRRREREAALVRQSSLCLEEALDAIADIRSAQLELRASLADDTDAFARGSLLRFSEEELSASSWSPDDDAQRLLAGESLDDDSLAPKKPDVSPRTQRALQSGGLEVGDA